MLIILLSELFLVALIVLVLPRVKVLRGWRPKMFRPLQKALQTRPWLATCLAALFSLLINAVLTLIQPPAPEVHDEFSYLLAADTFSHGRLTNPTHPLWEHFESFHIIQQPTYASKYPPGQGLLLALGQSLTGKPIVGSWLGVALMVAAVSWMFQGWMPFRWALFGSVLFAANAGLYLFWGQTYWGGELPLAGAALALGAMPRLVRTRHIRDAVIMASGISLLAMTRPYEGMLFTSLIGLATCWRLYKSQVSIREACLKIMLPGATVLLLMFTFLFYYNSTVTGDVKTFPYMVHHQQYEVSPFFLWESPPATGKTFVHSVLARFHQQEMMASFHQQQELPGFLRIKLQHLFFVWLQFGNVVLALAIFFCCHRGAFRKCFPWMAGFVFLLLALLATPWWLQGHYFAASAPFLLLIILTGLRHIRVAWKRRGRWVLAGLTAMYIGVFVFRLTLYAAAEPNQWQHHRARLVQQLNTTPGHDLVVVRYHKNHNPHQEWVYNAADLDGSQIVWAREMDPARNRRLLNYYKNRRIWLLLADADPPQLIEHKPQKPKSSPSNPSPKPAETVVQSR